MQPLEHGKRLSISHLDDGSTLPLVVTPTQPGTLHDWRADIQPLVEQYLPKHGGILFRGFEVAGASDFQAFARGFGHPLLNYEFGSTPRTDLGDGVYTSTEYPAHQVIPLHNEQSYTREWPMKIWFHCVHPGDSGGETPIADSREIYWRVDAALRRRFQERGLMYVRNYGNGLDIPWQQAFGTDDPEAVARFCREHGIDMEWKDDGELRTRQICQAVARHPKTGEWVWFNQAHLFHVSNLEASVRETLETVVDEVDLPRNVYYGDGAPIEEDALDHVRRALDASTVAFPWQAGDVLMLDNMLVAHARSTFTGPRKVIVAMAERFTAEALEA